MADTGVKSRTIALGLLEQVMRYRKPLDVALANGMWATRFAALPSSDQAFVKRLVQASLRRSGQARARFAKFLERPLGRGARKAELALIAGTIELVDLDAAPHAVVNSLVAAAAKDPKCRSYRGLLNAVLRRVAENKVDLRQEKVAYTNNVPGWLADSWRLRYGAETTESICRAFADQAPLDLTCKSSEDAGRVAEAVGGRVLANGSIRCGPHDAVDKMAMFDEGVWWVQDAAASMPVRLLGDVEGRTVADMCAAPGGKTLQLAARGARVIAVDQSKARLDLLRQNLARTHLRAEIVHGDAESVEFDVAPDAVLLDAPCSSTGIIRRHPDIAHTKTQQDVDEMSARQSGLLHACAERLAPGGLLVYCVCSLQAEEGPGQIEKFLSEKRGFVLDPICEKDDVPGEFVTAAGEMQSLPSQWEAEGGVDGFYAARLRKTE